MAELTTIARPYAKAAFLFAQENDTLAQWEKMLGLVATVAQDPAMNAFLDQPEVDSAEQAKAFAQVCGDELDEHGLNFIIQCAEHRRLAALPEIYQLFHQLLAAVEKTTDVELVSAFPLSDTETENLVAGLKKRLDSNVKINSRVDTSLIGGVVIRAGDTVIDGSVRGRLARLAEQLNT